MEKDFDTVLLLDAYAGLLTEKQITAYAICIIIKIIHLSEIAVIENTTRQAAQGMASARQSHKLLSF